MWLTERFCTKDIVLDETLLLPGSGNSANIVIAVLFFPKTTLLTNISSSAVVFLYHAVRDSVPALITNSEKSNRCNINFVIQYIFQCNIILICQQCIVSPRFTQVAKNNLLEILFHVYLYNFHIGLLFRKLETVFMIYPRHYYVLYHMHTYIIYIRTYVHTIHCILLLPCDCRIQQVQC